MPWKEPGEKPREPGGREPWGQGNRGSGPDLDAWLKKLQRALGPFGNGPLGALALIVLLVVLWFVIGGWTVVGNQQVGALLRFGSLQRILQPGFHIHFPAPVDRVEIVDTGRERTLSDEVRLLTSDGQLALVDYFVQYKVSDARKFLFGARDAEELARNAAVVAMRSVIGTHPLETVLNRDDDALANAARARLVDALKGADIGITVTGVGIQHASVPSDVKQAFDGITKAHEDAKTAQATARADVKRAHAEARARAQTMKADAEVYRSTAVTDAQARVARFEQVLPQYQAAPDVTRHRLWLDAMHDVLSRNQVVVNTGSGNVTVQFPTRGQATSNTKQPAASGSVAPAATSTPAGAATVPVTTGPTVQEQEP